MMHADTIRLPDPPQLTGGPGLLLRQPDASDAHDIVAHGRDAEAIRWTTIPVPYGRSDALDFIQRVADGWQADVAAFVIEHQRRFAGSVELRLENHGQANVGYALAPWARGHGVMTRSLRTVLAWGFTLPGLQLVRWKAHEGNWASRRVAQRCGFRMDGTVRGGVDQRGEPRDAWTGSLRRGDPLTRRPDER